MPCTSTVRSGWASAFNTLAASGRRCVACAACRPPCSVAIKDAGKEPPDLNRVLAGHQFTPKSLVSPGLFSIGREMFSRMAKSGPRPELANQPIEMVERGLSAVLFGRLAHLAAVVERAR